MVKMVSHIYFYAFSFLSIDTMEPPEPYFMDRMRDGLTKWRKGEGRDDFLVIRDPVRGRGVVSSKDIPNGVFVLEYESHMMTPEQALAIEKVYEAEGLGSYIVNTCYDHQGKKVNVCLDGTLCFQTLGRLVNHARGKPNLNHFRLIDVEPGQLPRLALFSTRLIPAGEELMWDYGIADTKKNRIDYPWIDFQCPEGPHQSYVDGR